MPTDLDRTEIDPEDPALAGMLDNLQCNILKSHGRDFAHHLFLRFIAPADDVRAWLRKLADTRVTSAKTQFAESRVFKATGRSGGPITAVLLSADGYQYLGLDPHRLHSRAFRKGMKHSGIDVKGAVFSTGNKDPDPAEWEAGFQGTIHALVVLADDDKAVLDAQVAAATAEINGVAVVAAAEGGNTLRRNGEPVEHFGYLDGRSNPAFTKPDMDREGQREGDAGIEVWNPSAPLGQVLVKDPFAVGDDAFGSFLVFRKLGQDVQAFNVRVADLAAALGVAPALAGALVVGRFKDGTPVVRADAPGLGAQNSFAFTEDEEGSKCPFHAHIRKVNPRGTTPLTSEKSERGRRIIRRGIPYGLPMPGTADPTVPSDSDPAAPRGLLFMCFQADIAEQFEFIQRVWVDNPNFPRPIVPLPFVRNTGDDPLIGQDRDEAQRWPTAWGDDEARRKAFNFESLVTLKGGEYFFCPSLAFLRAL